MGIKAGDTSGGEEHTFGGWFGEQVEDLDGYDPSFLGSGTSVFCPGRDASGGMTLKEVGVSRGSIIHFVVTTPFPLLRGVIV